MTLQAADIGEVFRISSVSDAEAESQLIRMGLSVGDLITCLTRLPAGPTVVRRGATEVALGRELANQISVERP